MLLSMASCFVVPLFKHVNSLVINGKADQCEVDTHYTCLYTDGAFYASFCLTGLLVLSLMATLSSAHPASVPGPGLANMGRCSPPALCFSISEGQTAVVVRRTIQPVW